MTFFDQVAASKSKIIQHEFTQFMQPKQFALTDILNLTQETKEELSLELHAHMVGSLKRMDETVLRVEQQRYDLDQLIESAE